MSWKFWQKDEPETRGYHDSFLNALVAQAEGSLSGSPLGLAALEMAAGSYARCMASATITPDTPVTRALTPSIRAHIGRDMIRQGGALLVISVEDGMVELSPAGDWNVLGGWHERDWRYTCYLYGASETKAMYLPSQGVCHMRYSFDALRPWISVGPLGWASSTATLASNLESKLGMEAGGPVGHVMAIPLDPKKSGAKGREGADPNTVQPLDALRADLGAARGGTILSETLGGGWGDKDRGVRQEYKAARFGADPPPTLAVLRSDAGQAVLGACGVPVDLFSGSGSGQAARAAWQRFISGSVQAVADLACDELRKKLDVPDLSFSFDRLYTAGNVQERSAAFSKMVMAGMDITRAASLSGLIAMEEE